VFVASIKKRPRRDDARGRYFVDGDLDFEVRKFRVAAVEPTGRTKYIEAA
jgi:hypothetical protein